MLFPVLVRRFRPQDDCHAIAELISAKVGDQNLDLFYAD
jgi:hypothetical protein